MKKNPSLTDEQMQVLADIREKFGATTQILVSMEELCELACVCAKYPRYDDPTEAREKLYQSAVDEVADVTVVMNHIVNIMNLDMNDVNNRIAAKVNRVARWLKEGNTQDITTKDRTVGDTE